MMRYVVVGGPVRRAPTVISVAVASAAAVAINFATEWKTNPWAWLVVVLVTVLAAVVALRLDRRHPSPPSDLAGVADFLARAVHRQWSEEAAWRRLYNPPMLVRWNPSDSDLVADWPSLIRLGTAVGGPVPLGTWAADPTELAGSDNDLVTVLSRVPTRRLVVLGEPGAGKTSLLVRLVLDLLSRRCSGEAVPVLLSLASWNPADQDLRSWIVQWLITEQPALAESAPDGMGVSGAQALLDAGLIFPVLDGLDEIPDAARGFAIAQINNAMRPGEPLVLAARTNEYRIAVCQPGEIGIRLTGAAGITLCPLDGSAVSDYLRDSVGGSTAAARWDGVLATLIADRESPVAEALKTPLMVALARAIYNPQPAETLCVIRQPTELLGFSTCEDVRQHLFDKFVPAAYRWDSDPKRRCAWTTDQVERWLVFLARDLEYRQGGTTNFAWWKLSGAAPRPLAGIAVGLIAGLAGAVGSPFAMDFGSGLVSALLAGLLISKWFRFGRADLRMGLVGGLLGGLIGALGALAAFGTGVGNVFVGAFLMGGLAFGIAVAPLARFASGFAGGLAGEFVAATVIYEVGSVFGPVARLMNGLGLGLVAGLAVRLQARSLPARKLRWSSVGVICGLGCGLVIGFALWIQVGSASSFLIGLASMVAGGYAGGLFEAIPLDPTKATNPKTVLVRDRATFRSTCLGLGLSIGLATTLAMTFSLNFNNGLPNGLRFGLGVGLVNLIAAGLTFGFLQASWGSFVLARWWLAATRRLPWRLMAFLEDAHEKRGVLRQVGVYYQFRHIELQHHLASNRRAM